VFGALEFPVSDVPFQEIVDRVAAGEYQAKPARVFRFEEIQDAHRLMEPVSFAASSRYSLIRVTST